jgi:uncharacterized protein
VLRSLSRRLPRVLRRLIVVAASLLVFAAAGTGAVASAIAHAPNARAEARRDSPPPELARYHVRELVAPVGPPAAHLSAWVLEPERVPPLGTVVVLHGVRLDKRSMLPVATALTDAGFRSVLVDLRGHGASTGEYLTYGVVESRDVSELLDALSADGTELGPVGVHGFSYGAATAIQLAAEDGRVRAVVAVSSFSSLRAAVRGYVHWQAAAIEPIVSDRWLDAAIDLGAHVAHFDPDAASPARVAGHTRAQLMLIHGGADAQIPPENARAIERGADGRAELRVLPGETHASILADAHGTARALAVDFFERTLSGAGAPPRQRPGPG